MVAGININETPWFSQSEKIILHNMATRHIIIIKVIRVRNILQVRFSLRNVSTKH